MTIKYRDSFGRQRVATMQHLVRSGACNDCDGQLERVERYADHSIEVTARMLEVLSKKGLLSADDIREITGFGRDFEIIND